MKKFTFSSPIPKNYHYYRKFTSLTQPYGENKNKLFYGPLGHTGWDIQTQFAYTFTFDSVKKYIQSRFTGKKGYIPILAAHDGFLSMGFNDDQREGVYMKVTTEPFIEDGKAVEYQTLYFHLDSVRVFQGDLIKTTVEGRKGKNYVKRGTVLGTGGNSGRYTTGAHLHFEVKRRVKDGDVWGKWEILDPKLYCGKDTIFLYARNQLTNEYYYDGKMISKQEADLITFNY